MDPKEIYNKLADENTFNVAGIRVQFTQDISDTLLEPQNRIKAKKFLNSLRYGYIGTSLGKKNGITAITNLDKRIREHFLSFQGSDEYLLLVERGALSDPIGVKVVAHVPSGERMVGLYDQLNRKAIFYTIDGY